MRAMSIGVQLCSTEMRSVCAGFWESPVIISPQRDFRTILYFFPSCCFVEFHELESYKAVPRLRAMDIFSLCCVLSAPSTFWIQLDPASQILCLQKTERERGKKKNIVMFLYFCWIYSKVVWHYCFPKKLLICTSVMLVIIHPSP